MQIVRTGLQQEYRANLMSMETVMRNKVEMLRNELAALSCDVKAQVANGQRDQKSTAERVLHRIQQVCSPLHALQMTRYAAGVRHGPFEQGAWRMSPVHGATS